MKPDLVVVGATGAVGRMMLQVLDERDFPFNSLRLLSSARSAGSIVEFKGEKIKVEELTENSFAGGEVILSSAGGSVSKWFVPIARRAGCVVVDNTSAFRMDEDVPLVVPEVNPEDIKLHKGIIANPNCSTIQGVVALYPLHKVNPIKRIIFDTYQAVSGTGSAAVEELTVQAKQVLDGQTAIPHVYPHQIAFNILPEIDVFLDNGYTKEEWKMVEEARKIMHADDIAISATCVRVPVFTGHSISIHIEFSHPMSPDEARRILAHGTGVKILDDTTISLYPQPWSAAGSDEVFVGRIRKDVSHPNGLAIWVVSNNLRKGAALNAVQIAEEIIKREWLHPEAKK